MTHRGERVGGHGAGRSGADSPLHTLAAGSLIRVTIPSRVRKPYIALDSTAALESEDLGEAPDRLFATDPRLDRSCRPAR